MQGEWSVVARDSVHMVQSSCLLTVTIPKHYKKPRFLEPLKAVLTDEGAVNLECKVRGAKQCNIRAADKLCVGSGGFSDFKLENYFMLAFGIICLRCNVNQQSISLLLNAKFIL